MCFINMRIPRHNEWCRELMKSAIFRTDL